MDWKPDEALPPMDPPELQLVEVVDFNYEETDSRVFGFIELGNLVSSFEPTVSPTHHGISWKEPAFEPLPELMPTFTTHFSRSTWTTKLVRLTFGGGNRRRAQYCGQADASIGTNVQRRAGERAEDEDSAHTQDPLSHVRPLDLDAA